MWNGILNKNVYPYANIQGTHTIWLQLKKLLLFLIGSDVVYFAKSIDGWGTERDDNNGATYNKNSFVDASDVLFELVGFVVVHTKLGSELIEILVIWMIF